MRVQICWRGVCAALCDYCAFSLDLLDMYNTIVDSVFTLRAAKCFFVFYFWLLVSVYLPLSSANSTDCQRSLPLSLNKNAYNSNFAYAQRKRTTDARDDAYNFWPPNLPLTKKNNNNNKRGVTLKPFPLVHRFTSCRCSLDPAQAAWPPFFINLTLEELGKDISSFFSLTGSIFHTCSSLRSQLDDTVKRTGSTFGYFQEALVRCGQTKGPARLLS